MKISKTLFIFLFVIIVLAALYPRLATHPISLFLLKGADGAVEAFKISAPLNGKEETVESIPLNAEQKKEGGEILGQKDAQHLKTFSKTFGAYPVVIGIPVTQEGWPGFLGGGLKGVFADNMPDVFDNLQLTDRVYFSLFLQAPPPAPFVNEQGTRVAAPVPTPGASISHPVSTPNAAPTPSVVRVEILNGCGITNAADWAARRVKGPGIIITDTDNADNFHYPKTIVRTCAGMPVALEEAVERLGLSKDAIQEIPSLSSSVDVVIIVGRDYPKLRERYRERNRH